MAMAKLSPGMMESVKRALQIYVNEVENSPLMPLTKRTYLLHAENFVRWLDDDFEPGARKARGGS